MSSADPVHAALAVSSSRQLVAIAVGMQLRVLDTNEKVARVLPLAAAAGVAVPPLVRAAAFSPDSSRLAATTDDKQLHMWDTQSWECELTTPLPKKASCLAFTADGSCLLAGDKFGDVQAARLLSTCGGGGPGGADGGSSASPPTVEVLLGHYSSALTSLAISASGNMLATADRDGRVRISVLPPTGTAGGMHEVLCYCLGHTAFVTCCAFMPMPGGELLLSGGGDGTLRMWQPRTGQQLQCLHLSAAGNNLTAVLDVAVSSNGRHVAAIVDGRDAVFLTRKASQADATLEEGTWFSLAGLHIPSQLHFDGSDRLWVVGGPPSDSSTRTYLMCASVTPEGKLRDVLASLVPADMRAEAEGGQGAEAAESGAPRRLLSAHLAKHAYSQDDIEHRKRQRRDKKL